MQYGRLGSVGGLIPPLIHCRLVGLLVEFEYVFSEFNVRGEFSETNFPKKKWLNFGTLYPGPNSRKKMPQFLELLPGA